MSLTNCHFPNFFDCGDSFEFNSSVQPTIQNGIQKNMIIDIVLEG